VTPERKGGGAILAPHSRRWWSVMSGHTFLA
jgi:hypothetical protein